MIHTLLIIVAIWFAIAVPAAVVIGHMIRRADSTHPE